VQEATDAEAGAGEEAAAEAEAAEAQRAPSPGEAVEEDEEAYITKPATPLDEDVQAGLGLEEAAGAAKETIVLYFTEISHILQVKYRDSADPGRKGEGSSWLHASPGAAVL
jgi:hypothetical protein